MRFGRKKKKFRLLRIAVEEWTEANAQLASDYVKTETWRRQKSILHGILVQRILRGESDDYRRGYHDAIEDISAHGREQHPIQDSKETTTIQSEDDFY